MPSERTSLDIGECQHAVIDKLGIVFVCAGKCASGSMKRQAQRSQGQIVKIPTHEVYKSQYFKIAIWRDPVSRLSSCYADKIKRGFFTGFKFVDGMYPKMSFREFVKVVCKTPDDKSDGHFRSQHCFYNYEENFLPDVMIDFKNLPESWGIAQTKGLERGVVVPNLVKRGHETPKNQRVSLDHVTTNVQMMIEKRYAKDYEMRGMISYE